MLPKLDLPRFKHKLTGLNKQIHYRPFTVKEQKILLHAKESEDTENYFEAMKQVLELCTFGKIDIDSLTFFDIEDLFVRVRAKSVSEEVEIKYAVKDEEGNKTNEQLSVIINLNDVKVHVPDNHVKKFMLTDKIGVQMKYPSMASLADEKDEFELIKECIDFVYDEQEIYYFKDSTPEEVDEFIDSIDIDAMMKISDFFKTLPRIRYETEVTLKDGTVKKLVYEGIEDFFG